MRVAAILLMSIIFPTFVSADLYSYGMLTNDVGTLHSSVKNDGAITNILANVTAVGTNVNFRFNGTLSGSAVTALDAIVAANPTNVPSGLPLEIYNMPVSLCASDSAVPTTVYSGNWETFEFSAAATKKAWLTTRYPDNVDTNRLLCIMFLWKENVVGAASGLVFKIDCRYVKVGVDNSDKAVDQTFMMTNYVDNVQHQTYVLMVVLDAAAAQDSTIVSIEISREVNDSADDWTGSVGLDKHAMFMYYQGRF